MSTRFHYRKDFIMKLKKILSFFLVLVMLCSCFIMSTSAAEQDALPFKDVGKKKWFYDAVKYMYDGGLMNGTSDTKFDPNGKLSRAMFITILGRLAGAEEKESDVFPDIKKNSWYSGYVGWAVEAGVVKGYDDGTFKPNKSLSRQEMAVAVDRFITYLDCRMTSEGGMWNFNDQKKVASWAKDSLAVLRNSGVVEGDQYGNFNPKNNITRAEAATIIMKLQKAIANAWQGYLPEDGAEPIVLGASYLYWTGSACAGGMAHDLDKSGDLPVLETYMDEFEARKTYHFPNTIGVSLSYMNIDVKEYPFVKVAYKFDGAENTVPTAAYISNKTKSENSGFEEAVTFTAGADDAGIKTATADLSAIPANHADYYGSNKIANLLFTPFALDYTGDAKFDILYIGFFKTKAEADAFTANSNADIETYLKEYEPYTSLNWKEYTDEDAAYYDKLLADRIKEIKNSESELTPEDVKAKGGNVYYMSSKNGDDSNDGKTPETAWKTPRRLFDVKAGGKVWLQTVLKTGDGVFFERGNTFYAEHLNTSEYPTSESSLITQVGCYYGAYGVGDKPLFTASIDFSDSNNTGNWKATEYTNIWVIDCPERTGDVGRIYFNEGEAVGVRVIADSGDTQTFAEGVKSNDKGYCSTGYEFYYSGNTDMTNAGTALKHNLEFFYDNVENKVYLYWDKGNPSDSFDDIKVPRGGSAWLKDGCTIDNLAFMYNTNHGAHVGGRDIKIQNCEVGYVGGGLSSVESGFETFGTTNGLYFYNNYIHDIGDGGITSQGMSTADNFNQIQNVEYVGNVMVACGHSAEIWMGIVEDEDGNVLNPISNVLIKDNIMAYNGYGVRGKQAREISTQGELICGGHDSELSNCRIEDNIFLHGQGALYTTNVATYKQPRGWMAKNNIYICNTEFMNIGYCYETLNHINHHMWKRARVSFPYSYEGVVWYTSQGVDPMGTYYYYSDMTDGESKKCYFITGYYVERGDFKVK